MSNDSDISYIGGIEFNVFSNEVIKKYSSIKEDNGIILPESYDNSEPKRGGLVDTRLGTTDTNVLCAYCGLGNNLCPGHFGHTQFVAPLFHYGYFEKYVKGILDCICLRSSRLLIHKNPNELNKLVRQYNGRKRFLEIKKASQGITESDVGVPVPKIKVEKKKSTGAIYLVAETSISNVINDDGEVEDKKVIKEDLDASDVYNIFRNITNIDFELLGFNPKKYRPEDLLILTFPVPPVAIRPSLRADFLASACYEDDLTHKLSDIINNYNFKI